MTNEKILELWLKGFSKYKVADMYMYQYNQMIKVVRYDITQRNVKFITRKQALRRVETIIYNYLMEDKNK